MILRVSIWDVGCSYVCTFVPFLFFHFWLSSFLPATFLLNINIRGSHSVSAAPTE